MAERRRYTKREKVSAVTAALASSVTAAAEAQGIPATTLEYWTKHPEFVELREKARAELAPIATTAAFLAWAEAIRLLRAGQMEPHDVLFFAGLATDKAQLLSGAATVRTETKALSDGLDDHEKQTLRDVIDGALAESAEAGAGGDPVGVGTEVRQ